MRFMDASVNWITPAMISGLEKTLFDVRIANFKVGEARRIGIHPTLVSVPEETAARLREESRRDSFAVRDGQIDILDLVNRSCPILARVLRDGGA